MTKSEHKEIAALLDAYDANLDIVSRFMKSVLLALTESSLLAPHCHSFKSRMKSRASLKDKLERKLAASKSHGPRFGVNPRNLLLKINDLAGIRILHLHTTQFTKIDVALRDIFNEERYVLVEGPFARTWDDESRAFFGVNGVRVENSPTLYTSVHYIIESDSRTKVTCEIQVRTLMEEVWGEVDHLVNYPHKSTSVACGEQIKALARSTSAATRLVDSIFATVEDHNQHKRRRRPKRKQQH
jgi:putative GTP pyrophosphokinase